MDDMEKLVEFLQQHWGNLGKHTFNENANNLFGDMDLFVSLNGLVVLAVEAGEPKALMSLLISALKVSYDLGKESMLQ